MSKVALCFFLNLIGRGGGSSLWPSEEDRNWNCALQSTGELIFTKGDNSVKIDGQFSRCPKGEMSMDPLYASYDVNRDETKQNPAYSPFNDELVSTTSGGRYRVVETEIKCDLQTGSYIHIFFYSTSGLDLNTSKNLNTSKKRRCDEARKIWNKFPQPGKYH